MAGWRSRASRRNSRLRSQDRTNVAAWQHGDCRRQCIARAAATHHMDAKRAVCPAIKCGRGSAEFGHRRRYGGSATCFSPSAWRPLRTRFGEPDAVIARWPLWRVMAWIGVQLCGKWAVKGGGSGGWQDKSGASRRGVGMQICVAFRASRLVPRLAPFRRIRAIPPCAEPAAIPRRNRP